MNMKKKLLLLLICCLTAVCSFAQDSGTCGENLSWSFDRETEKLRISGTGAMTDYSSSLSLPWYDYRSQIKQVEIEDGATNIGNRAFYWCSRLAYITIPNSITGIGSQAFYYCSSLTSVTIPVGVASIGTFAFSGCSGLTSIAIPASVTSIEDGAFYYCPGLASIEVENANPSYSSADGVLFDREKTVLICWPTGKSGSYTVPGSVTDIGDWAFSDCTGLTSISIPNSVTGIGNSAFSDCTGLASVSVGNSVESIGYWAFYGCIGLTSVTLPESVTDIGSSAFSGCTGLASITNSNPVPIKIGSDVFNAVNKTGCVLKVPTKSIDLYRDADVWKEFLKIEAIQGTNMPEIPEISAIQIYPNPVAESFRIKGMEESTVVSILDINGRMVLQRMVNPDEAIEVGHLPKGIYLVNVKGRTTKMVKQ
jgi:hypothetical protein